MYGQKKTRANERQMNSKMMNLRKKMGNKYGKKRHQNPEGGLNEEGRKYFKRTEGNLKRPLSSGTNLIWVSFAARFGNEGANER